MSPRLLHWTIRFFSVRCEPSHHTITPLYHKLQPHSVTRSFIPAHVASSLDLARSSPGLRTKQLRCNREENDRYFRRTVSLPDRLRRIAADQSRNHAAAGADDHFERRAQVERIG